MYPKEYIQFLVHFHGDRDYFECHEILEEYWKESPDPHKGSIWVAFILVAVSAYHHRRKNFKGAKRTMEKAIKIFSTKGSELITLGLDKQALLPLLKRQLEAIEEEKDYESFNLPISDPTLIEECVLTCKLNGFSWGNVSDLSNHIVIHKHKQRDRTSVIEERLQALNRRKGSE